MSDPTTGVIHYKTECFRYSTTHQLGKGKGCVFLALVFNFIILQIRRYSKSIFVVTSLSLALSVLEFVFVIHPWLSPTTHNMNHTAALKKTPETIAKDSVRLHT